MSSLIIPPQQLRHSPSAASLRHSVEHEDDLATVARSSRRNSTSDLATSPHAVSGQQLSLVPPQPTLATMQARDKIDPGDRTLHQPDIHKGLVDLYAGRSHRQFTFPVHRLLEASPYFTKLLAENEGHDGSQGVPEQETYEDVDEFVMALFHRWLEDGGRLAGPSDFHSTQHYLGLYILARKFGIEKLENQGMSTLNALWNVADVFP